MLTIRSLLFHSLFYLVNALQMIFWTPAFFIMPRKTAWKVAKSWAYSLIWLQHVVCGTRYSFLGLNNIRPSINQLVASKHQSQWETYTMILFFDDSGYVLKRILMFTPLFGWYMKKMKLVPVDRGRGSLALASMTKNTREQMTERNRQVIIYPEGTRTVPGNQPRYKYGITHLYSELNVQVQPVALNSGLFWGRKEMNVYPGTITMEFLEPIEPGLSKNDFSKLLQERIETACDRMNAEVAAQDNPPPLALEIAGNAGNAAGANS